MVTYHVDTSNISNASQPNVSIDATANDSVHVNDSIHDRNVNFSSSTPRKFTGPKDDANDQIGNTYIRPQWQHRMPRYLEEYQL